MKLTNSDIEKIKEEIEHRKLVVRPKAIEAVKEARAQGDLSENFEYHAAKKDKNKKDRDKSKPLHFISSDGFDMYVGKNNIQNEELTFKIATGNDWWFHSKTFPGSHVIVKCNNKDLPDNTFEEAARLAAFYSKGSNQDKVEIVYIQKKHIKKVAGAMPGFVIYHTNFSMTIAPDISGIKEVK